jgi:NAD(P)-dependent dehydrogenase (short-subunit alcohol dehydrogenase family)
MSAQKLHTTKHEGKIALVTGGTSGIGLATAQRLALEGAKVVVTGRRQPELDAAVQKIGRNASAVRGDIANLENLDVLVGAIKERHGRLDILFANAGTGELLPLGAITEAHVDRIFGINVKGTLFTVQKALPLMPAGSAIVITGRWRPARACQRSACSRLTSRNLGELSITGHLRCFSDQPVAEIVQCGEPILSCEIPRLG